VMDEMEETRHFAAAIIEMAQRRPHRSIFVYRSITPSVSSITVLNVNRFYWSYDITTNQFYPPTREDILFFTPVYEWPPEVAATLWTNSAVDWVDPNTFERLLPSYLLEAPNKQYDILPDKLLEWQQAASPEFRVAAQQLTKGFRYVPYTEFVNTLDDVAKTL